MSRVGRKPIAIPANVKVDVKDHQVQVKGPRGTLQLAIPEGITLQANKSELVAERRDDSFAPLHGLTRSLVANAVQGVSAGFQKELDIVGVGYRAEMKGKTILVLSLGFSHLIEYRLPPEIEIAVDAKLTHLTITGTDRQRVGQVAAELRALRPPDPYKNKGVRYTGERLRKKEGKTGAK
ncbi:MAG TPA: 50S ribosomal protein L6 [Terriglobales bacterium]|nr:50S ribosomal protein L6 [Terriglobales bacterium]